MMRLVRIALERPYTFVVMATLIAILGIASILTMPTDIFPAIDIPVVSVVWNYNGLAPDDMANRIVTISERAMTTTVNAVHADRLLSQHPVAERIGDGSRASHAIRRQRPLALAPGRPKGPFPGCDRKRSPVRESFWPELPSEYGRASR